MGPKCWSISKLLQSTVETHRVDGGNHPVEKYAQVNLDHFPNVWGMFEQELKSSPSDLPGPWNCV